MIELLLTEMKDPYVRENIRRIKLLFKDIEDRLSSTEASSGDTINNIVSASVWDKITENVNASSTKTIDTVALSNFKTAKYIISVRDATNDKTSALEINIKNQASSLQDVVSAKISGGISFNIDAVVNGSDMNLNITNNEIVGLDIVMAKLVL